jgi:hypothetical protein
LRLPFSLLLMIMQNTLEQLRKHSLTDAGYVTLQDPLSVPVLVQFLELVDVLQQVELTQGITYSVQWKWTASDDYSASTAYKAFHAGLELFPCGKTIWDTWAPGKCKIHVWLALQCRLWTADRMLRHGMNSHTTCPLCDKNLSQPII